MSHVKFDKLENSVRTCELWTCWEENYQRRKINISELSFLSIKDKRFIIYFYFNFFIFYFLVTNSNSTSSDRIGNSQTRSFQYARGVRQGGILSPLLFMPIRQ